MKIKEGGVTMNTITEYNTTPTFYPMSEKGNELQIENSDDNKLFNSDILELKGKEQAAEKAQKAEKAEISKKTMMDLKEMKSFLFMLIGSDLMVETDELKKGNTFNSLA